ncbi:hypothetical protein, partial [Streptomyces sp. UNOC14_S4]|uniref:hypothetical protein n=1 Tax=Streptomyces sp. UNOC14_S4 TaxID=2872340 RepID=UPI001E3C62B3
MTRLLARLGTLLGVLALVISIGAPLALAGAKPPDPYPPELSHGERIGINVNTGEYCDLDKADAAQDQDPNAKSSCRPPTDCQDFPAGQTVCVGEDATDPKERQQYELNELKRWQDKADKKDPYYNKYNDYITNCVKKDEKPFAQCREEAVGKFGVATKGPLDWVAGKISEMASNALKEAAGAIGESVVWLLKQFAEAFDEISTIKLAKTGIGPVMGIATGLSVLVATFLLLLQFGKLAVSQQGGPLVTAITGLAKWGVVLGVYVFATQTALDWSDTLSTALINHTFDGGGTSDTDASQAMTKQLTMLFGGLVTGGGGAATATTALVSGEGVLASAVGVIIVVGILCIIAIGALWVEMLVRQAGIMILVTMMPLALAGQMSDATRDWWPKARNALISLILMKPVIVICFSIGFSAMKGGEGIRNVLVGLIIFIISAFAWPVIAKFMVFTTVGAGGAAAGGMLSSVGSSVSSMFGGNQAAPAGAGTASGGSNYTKAVEDDNNSIAGGGGSGGGFWSKAMGGSTGGGAAAKAGGAAAAGLGLALAGKDMLESTGANVAAHAGLDQGAPGGGGQGISRRPQGGEAEPPGPAPAPSASASEVTTADTTAPSSGSVTPPPRQPDATP